MNTRFNKSDAAKMVGVARPTFYRHIEDKGITVEKDTEGKEWIDLSELIRVYGHDALRLDKPDKQGNDVSKTSVEVSTAVQTDLTIKIAQLEAKNDFLEEQKDHYKTLYEEEKTERKASTLLLTDQREKTDEWQKMLKGIESRLANSEKQMKEQEQQATELLRQNKLLKKAMYNEKNKTIWAKIFGSKTKKMLQKAR